ncbi:MAG: type II toxin-antitoxin system YafQ family toxin [Cardiobacteriaceae bacterium]|nr:type II toxin-antitoxin system YafQ family toxin [Cardiobacteriaceae bacterium]
MKRLLVPSNAFKRDAKKRWEILLSAEWTTIAHCLLNGTDIPAKHRDHALTGNWGGFRECHIKPDVLLIYAVENHEIKLVRLGSHAELFD